MPVKGDIGTAVLMAPLPYLCINAHKHDALLIEEVKTEFKMLKIHLEKYGITMHHHLRPTVSAMHYRKAYYL